MKKKSELMLKFDALEEKRDSQISSYRPDRFMLEKRKAIQKEINDLVNQMAPVDESFAEYIDDRRIPRGALYPSGIKCVDPSQNRGSTYYVSEITGCSREVQYESDLGGVGYGPELEYDKQIKFGQCSKFMGWEGFSIPEATSVKERD
ncbi:MAG: hypothetical protein FWE16_04305 [Firmicutes bacterium]|nr:hypothetical protein [Bacillota bacterium]